MLPLSHILQQRVMMHWECDLMIGDCQMRMKQQYYCIVILVQYLGIQEGYQLSAIVASTKVHLFFHKDFRNNEAMN